MMFEMRLESTAWQNRAEKATIMWHTEREALGGILRLVEEM